MARSDWVVLVTEPAFEYKVRNDLERLGLRPYLSQSRRRWLLPHGGILNKLVPTFPCTLLLPIGELDPPIVAHLRQPSPVLTDSRGRPWLLFGSVVSALMLSEMQREFDDERSVARHHQQADADLGVAPRFSLRLDRALCRDSEPAVRQLVAALSCAARFAPAVHAGA
jgi:hypothetical protein